MEQLVGLVQTYAWGDTNVIAEMQGRPSSTAPEAELWFGAHPMGPSHLVESQQLLADAVQSRPDEVLGPKVGTRFGRFPYLLKVLAAAQPLSIQVHPDLAQARAGFAREEAAGLSRHSSKRTYRDDNHKPELICALTPFEAKCGFRPLEDTLTLLNAVADGGGAGPAELCDRLSTGVDPTTQLSDVLQWLLGLPAERATKLVTELVYGTSRLLTGAALPVDLAGFEPELAWTAKLNDFYRGDIGVAVALLLNHIVLAPGQAMFLRAGNMHTYLRGAGVELMANSDNVIRGGLTVKHVDVDELVGVVDTSPAPAPVQSPDGPCHRYETPVPDFSLTRLSDGVERSFEPLGPDIILVTDGAATLTTANDGRCCVVGRGEAAIMEWSDGPYRIVLSPSALAWRASVGDLAL